MLGAKGLDPHLLGSGYTSSDMGTTVSALYLPLTDPRDKSMELEPLILSTPDAALPACGVELEGTALILVP